MNGEHPNTVKTVMRHSSITLTMDTYGHLFPGQDAEAVAKMPNILGDASDTPEALAATGTDSLLPADRQQWTGKTTRETAKPGDWNEMGSGDENSPQVVPLSVLGDKRRDVSKGSGGGTRTHDTRIMIPLL